MSYAQRQKADQKTTLHFAPLPDSDEEDVYDRNTRLRAGLKLLLDGYSYSQELGANLWDFAIEIAFLYTAGLNNNDLRWLVGKGYVKHGLDTTAKGKVRPIEHRGGRMLLPSGSCFVLTGTGREFARKMVAGGESGVAKCQSERHSKDGLREQKDRPHWDSELHNLYWQGQLVKHFKHEAPFQEAILEAFQSCNWTQYVVVMLPREEGINPKERLREAIKNLNRNCARNLRFVQEGNGGRVAWQPLD